jgi:hypothetical protein
MCAWRPDLSADLPGPLTGPVATPHIVYYILYHIFMFVLMYTTRTTQITFHNPGSYHITSGIPHFMLLPQPNFT